MVRKTHPNQNSKTSSWSWKKTGKVLLYIFLWLLFFLLAGGVAAVGAGAGMVAALVKHQEVYSKEEMIAMINSNPLTTTIYFRDGRPIGQLQADEDRKMVTLDEVPDHLKHAFIATEDRTFYTNPGVDIRGLTVPCFSSSPNPPCRRGEHHHPAIGEKRRAGGQRSHLSPARRERYFWPCGSAASCPKKKFSPLISTKSTLASALTIPKFTACRRLPKDFWRRRKGSQPGTVRLHRRHGPKPRQLFPFFGRGTGKREKTPANGAGLYVGRRITSPSKSMRKHCNFL